jgi:hypothetical protein
MSQLCPLGMTKKTFSWTSPIGQEMIKISKSNRSDEEWQGEFPSGKIVHFGASGNTDHTPNKDPAVKNQNLARHSAGNEDWKNPETPAFLSRWLLWNKTSLKAAIKDTNNRFGTHFSRVMYLGSLEVRLERP